MFFLWGYGIVFATAGHEQGQNRRCGNAVMKRFHLEKHEESPDGWD